METIDCIKTRRSVRQFTDQPVSHEELEQIIQLAAYAPSWKNTQTSRFIAVYDRAKLTQLAEECILGFKGNYNTILHAPCLVVLTTVDGRSGYERDGSFTTSKGTHWQSFDAGISAQTLCLAAHQLGLGTVVMGIYDEPRWPRWWGAGRPVRFGADCPGASGSGTGHAQTQGAGYAAVLPGRLKQSKTK